MLKHVVFFTNGELYSSHCTWLIGAYDSLGEAKAHAERINQAVLRCPENPCGVGRVASSELVSLLPLAGEIQDMGMYPHKPLREEQFISDHVAFVISVENPT